MNEIVIGVLFLIMFVQQGIHWKERRELLNRLMARDLAEYMIYGKRKKRQKRTDNPIRDNIKNGYKERYASDDE